ncbi:MAG: chemotaxis response regulator protein-glutamate methylesterase [Clostridiaceae bacterium]|nr:chemotaxis response regulator protein-glutamate methylesterase [Clostridiaceae bacterium]
MKNIKVIVVDDSALMRKIISDMINSTDDMEVIDSCRNGQDLMTKLSVLSPHVITLDVEMPIMDGLTTLREIKRRNIDIPTIILSSLSQSGTELSIDCLEAGAFDIVPKPSGTISLDIDKVKVELLSKIKVAYGRKNQNSKINKLEDRTKVEERPIVEVKRKGYQKVDVKGYIDAVVIGASTGGPKALYTVVTALPENVGVPIFIVQHMPIGFTKAFADRLNANSDIKVVEAQDKELINKDTVYIAPAGLHMEVGSDNRIHLNSEPTMWGVRPAVDKLFISASKVYENHLLSVVLTGMGKDGAGGTVQVKDNGGITISQDESTSTIYGMPKATFETGKVDLVCPIDEVPVQIVRILTSNRR